MNPQHAELFGRYQMHPISTAADWPYPVHALLRPAATPLPALSLLTSKSAAQTSIYTRR